MGREQKEKVLREQRVTQVLENTPEAKLAHRLQKIKERITGGLVSTVNERQQNIAWIDKAINTIGLGELALKKTEIEEITLLKSDVEVAYQEAYQYFSKVDDLLADKQLNEQTAALMMSRQQAAVDNVERHFNTLISLLDTIVSTTSKDEQLLALSSLETFLNKQQFKRSHTAEDPNQMPWGSPEGIVKAPASTEQELLLKNRASVMAATTTFSEVESVQHGNIEYLNENIEIQFTEEIKVLAASLNNNPTEIYAWVHNNIRFIPSYGSIQGAQMTLETKSGNAIDTASLLISLLRVSGIPARYAYGTVEIPVEEAMNWVGGVTTPEAALNLMGQGGIPSIGLNRGGIITDIRLEHTWVEAWVDFEPSRGVKNKEGDNWIPMDASFKQYEYAIGLEIDSPLKQDAESIVAAVQNTSTINQQEGWLQSPDMLRIDGLLSELNQKVIDSGNNHSQNNRIVDILGQGIVSVRPPMPLASGLPYKLIINANKYAEIPGNLKHLFTYELANSSYGIKGSSILKITRPTASLGTKQLAVSFKPATPEDEVLLFDSLPSDANSSALIPQSIPGYLISMNAEFTLDGVVIDSGAGGQLGGELFEELGLWSPAHGWNKSKNQPIAGEYRAIGLDLQGISVSKLNKIADGNNNITNDASLGNVTSLDKHQLIGNLMQGVIHNYFAINDAMDYQLSRVVGVTTYRLPSYGIFSTSLSPQYWFGMPRNVTVGGMNMDVDFMHSQSVANNNQQDNVRDFMLSVGNRASALEHVVPEQMLSIEDGQAFAISAVKALALAASQGQKIWQIKEDNLDLSLAQINLSDDIELEIRNAVYSGKIVSTHSYEVVYEGWVGAGYILLDPLTGSAAYKISGGSNGGDTLPGNLLIGSGAILGLTDGFTSAKNPNGEPWFSKVLKKLWKQGQMSKWAGYLGLGIALMMVAFDENLSTSDKVGQASMNLLGFGITAYLVAAIAGVGAIPFLAVALLGFVIAMAIAVAITLINSMYFTRLNRKQMVVA